jgi:hypothetical protein
VYKAVGRRIVRRLAGARLVARDAAAEVAQPDGVAVHQDVGYVRSAYGVAPLGRAERRGRADH